MNKIERPRKKQMYLTMKSKQKICLQKQADPTLTIDQLSEEYGCDRCTVSKVLKAKDEWLSKQLTEFEVKKIVKQASEVHTYDVLPNSTPTLNPRFYPPSHISTNCLVP